MSVDKTNCAALTKVESCPYYKCRPFKYLMKPDKKIPRTLLRCLAVTLYFRHRRELSNDERKLLPPGRESAWRGLKQKKSSLVMVEVYSNRRLLATS